MSWKISPSLSLPHQPRGVQYTQPRAFKSLADEIDFNRKWLGGGKPVYQKGSKALRYGKFAAKMLPHVRIALTAWEFYNIGVYIYDSYMVQQQETPQPSQSYIGSNSSDRSTQFSPYQYPHIVGYQDEGPVHWSRTV